MSSIPSKQSSSISNIPSKQSSSISNIPSKQFSSILSSRQSSRSKQLINKKCKASANNNVAFLMTILRKYKNKELSEIDEFIRKSIKNILEISCPNLD
jgi:hypothetical protein